MVAETFTQDLHVSAFPERCWDVLTDIHELSSWVSVVHDAEEISRLSSYRAVLQDQVGPFKLRALLDIRVQVVEEGCHVRISAAGKDSHVNSQLSFDAEMKLEPLQLGTLLTIIGKYSVTGKVAAMGSGIIRKKADVLLREFFGGAARKLGELAQD